jgi:Neuraminidase (sialidase)
MFKLCRPSSLVILVSFVPLSSAPAQVALKQLSRDIFTNTASQHATEVEPHIFAYGATLVSALQVGRVYGGGSADIGFATSTDGGATWTAGYLPGLTQAQNPANPYQYASDPSVAFDAKHGVWLIASLPLGSGQIPAVVVSRSSDGIHWGNPVGLATTSSSDKSWIVCDNGASSPNFGNCYVEWDDPGAGEVILMSASTDGGLTWGPPLATANNSPGIGGQPLVQPNGTVVVPIDNGSQGAILAFSSHDGGASWSSPVTVSRIREHFDPGGIRSGALPSAAVDMNGTVYVTWEDCRYRSGCTANDIVMSTSTDGTTWSAPARIPIDATTSGVDHFIPGLGADPQTAGSSAHLGLTYYYYSQGNCTASTCQLNVGFTASQDGGATWSAPVHLAGPMKLAWLPATSNGRMVGDYIATAFSQGKAYGVFAVAKVKSGSTFNEAIYTTAVGQSAVDSSVTFTSAGEIPVPDAISDRPPRATPILIR